MPQLGVVPTKLVLRKHITNGALPETLGVWAIFVINLKGLKHPANSGIYYS